MRRRRGICCSLALPMRLSRRSAFLAARAALSDFRGRTRGLDELIVRWRMLWGVEFATFASPKRMEGRKQLAGSEILKEVFARSHSR